MTTVRVRGEIDLATAPRLRASLIDVDRRGRHQLEVDLHDVDFVDSVGLGVLFGALRRARQAGGGLRVVAVSEPVGKLFDLLDLNAHFGITSGGGTVP